MALTRYDYQDQIVEQVGDPNNTVFPLMEALWSLYATRGPDELIALYVKRAAIDVRLAEESYDADFQVGQLRVSGSEVWTHLQAMRADVQTELLRVEARTAATRVPAFGTLAATTPTTPPFPDSADRNDSRYSGDPYQIRSGRIA